MGPGYRLVRTYRSGTGPPTATSSSGLCPRRPLGPCADGSPRHAELCHPTLTGTVTVGYSAVVSLADMPAGSPKSRQPHACSGDRGLALHLLGVSRDHFQPVNGHDSSVLDGGGRRRYRSGRAAPSPLERLRGLRSGRRPGMPGSGYRAAAATRWNVNQWRR